MKNSKEAVISKENAEAQVNDLFEAFEVDKDDRTDSFDPRKFFDKFVRYVMKGRLEISGIGDDITIVQNLRRKVGDRTSFKWDWSKLGIGKARIKISFDSLALHSQNFQCAGPMIGEEVSTIQNMHPNDLSIVEDIAGFFQGI